MAWRIPDSLAAYLSAAHAFNTGSFTLLYPRRLNADRNADTAELEMQGSFPSRIAGIVSTGNGTDFYGHATVGTTWVGAKTGSVGSALDTWTWRLVIGDGTNLYFFASPDSLDSGWSAFGSSPITQTAFDVNALLFGSNGREASNIDIGAVRLWDAPKNLTAMLAERGSRTAISASGLLLNKIADGASLALSLGVGTGTLTANGSVALVDGLPATLLPAGRLYPTLLAAPTSQYAVISQAQPALRTPVQFGDLETVVVRVSDVNQKLHKYATQQSWNADGTRLLLNNNGPYHLLDVTDGFNPISTSFDAGFQITFFDPVDPDLFWGQSSSARIRRGRLSGGSIPSVTVPGYTAINIGNGEGSISNDGRYLVFLGTRADGRDVCVWDTTTETVVTTIEFDGWGDADIDNCHISQSGNYVVVAVEKTGEKGHYVYARDGGAFIHRYETFAGHADVGYRANGDEILLRQRANGDFVTVRLSDGNVQVELPAAAASWGKHFSCRNILRPGYGYISTFYLADQSAKYCFREVYALKLDGTGRIERFGQSMFPEDGSETYDGEGHALPNPTGDMVAMKSHWIDGSPREYVMYVPGTSQPEPEPEPVTEVTVGGTVEVDPLITVQAEAVGDVVSFSGEYSSIGTPTITVALKSGDTTVDTKTPTGADGSYSGSFTSVADGTYTVEASITDDATSGGTTAVTGSLTVDDEVVPPDAPTSLAVASYTTSSVTLSWSGSADSYEVEVEYPDESTSVQTASSTGATIADLSPDTAYSFRVRAKTGDLYSGWTSPVAQTTAPAVPAAPNVSATTLSPSAIRIAWTDVGATEYKAYRKSSPSGQRTLIYTGALLTVDDTGLADGSLYYYDVSASNVSGTTFSQPVSATTLQSGGDPRVIVRAIERAEVGAEVAIIVQAVTGNGDAISSEAVTVTPSGVSVTGTLSGTTDVQGYAEFLLTPTEAGTLSVLAATAEASSTVTVEIVEPGTEDSATIAARLAAAEKKSTRTTPPPSQPPLESSAPPLALIPEASVSPLAALLNEMLLAPQPVIEPISLSGFMPPPQAAPPPSNGTQRAIEALDQAIAAQMQTLHQQLETLNKLIE